MHAGPCARCRHKAEWRRVHAMHSCRDCCTRLPALLAPAHIGGQRNSVQLTATGRQATSPQAQVQTHTRCLVHVHLCFNQGRIPSKQKCLKWESPQAFGAPEQAEARADGAVDEARGQARREWGKTYRIYGAPEQAKARTDGAVDEARGQARRRRRKTTGWAHLSRPKRAQMARSMKRVGRHMGASQFLGQSGVTT